MKKILALFLSVMLFSITLAAFAQENYQDVVYLKNGSIIRGIIIEQVPNESLKIQTKDGSIFAYEMTEVEKITKEQNPEILVEGNDGFFVGVSYNALMTTSPFDGVFNANYNPSVGMKLGYIFKNNFGFMFGGEFHINNRITGIGKIGPVYSFGPVILYPMVGIGFGAPVWHLSDKSGRALYLGAGFNFKFRNNVGIYVEPGFCRWGTDFGSIQMLEPFYSFVIALGTSYNF